MLMIGALVLVTACGEEKTADETPTDAVAEVEQTSAEPLSAQATTTQAEEVRGEPGSEQVEEADEEPTAEQVEEASPEPTEEQVAVPETQEYSGTGADVVIFDDELGQDAFTVHATYEGGGNFAVWSVGEDGSSIDLLVNTIGSYTGRAPLNFMDDPVGLQIEAEGPWAVTVDHLSLAPRWDGDRALKRAGDDVVILENGIEGLTKARITNKGESNFAVWAYGDDRDLLVNEIGNYDGRVLIPVGTVVLVVTSEGDWTIEIQ